MRFDLILFPLLGGYFFLILCPVTRYTHQRLERQRLLFHSAFVGGLLAFAAYSIKDHIGEKYLESIKGFLPTILLDSGWNTLFMTLPIGFGLGLLSWILGAFNWNFRRPSIKTGFWVKWSVKIFGDDFEKLFLDSVEKDWAVEITLKNDKVYVGKVIEIRRPNEQNQVRLLPLMSGYRNKDDKTLSFTTYYSKVYQHLKGKADTNLDMNIIIEKSEIISANRFDFEVYKLFGKTNQSPRRDDIRRKRMMLRNKSWR